MVSGSYLAYVFIFYWFKYFLLATSNVGWIMKRLIVLVLFSVSVNAQYQGICNYYSGKIAGIQESITLIERRVEEVNEYHGFPIYTTLPHLHLLRRLKNTEERNADMNWLCGFSKEDENSEVLRLPFSEYYKIEEEIR